MDEEYLIVVDDNEYPGYLEGYSPKELLDDDEINLYDSIDPKDYNDIPLRRKIIFRKNGETGNKFFKGTLLKIVPPSTFIMKNSIYYKIWPFNHENWEIRVMDIDKEREEINKKENLWKLYQAGKVYIDDSN